MLETQFVFVDTEAFYSCRFMFGKSALKRLSDLCRSGRLSLVLPEVTRREIEKKIGNDVDSFVSGLSKLDKKTPAVREYADADTALNALLDRDSIRGNVTAEFGKFLEEAKAEVLPFDASIMAEVLDSYFEQRPPFGTGKKKYEFPDALALTALDNWCAEEEVKCYVISRDPDVQAACNDADALIYVESLDDLFALAEIIDKKAAALLEAGREEIRRQITESFAGFGFAIYEEDGHVENIEVVDVTFLYLGIQDIEENVIRFIVKARVFFHGDVSYWDYTTAIYDSEDKVARPWQRIDRVVADEADVTAYGSIFAVDESLEEVEEVLVELNTSLTFEVDPYAEHFPNM